MAAGGIAKDGQTRKQQRGTRIMSRTFNVIIVAGLAGAVGWGATQRVSTDPAAALERGPGDEKADFEILHDGLQISGYVRDEVMAQGGSAIPVLIPFEMTRNATTARKHRFQLKITLDGYTAILGDAVLDYVINGTTRGYSRSDADADPGHEDDEYMMPYEDFDDGRGGSLSFGFRGGDYQVELYCLAEAPDPEANCLVAEEVEAFVYSLMGQ